MRKSSFITVTTAMVLAGCRGQIASIGGPSPEPTTPTILATSGPPIIVPSGTLAQSDKVDLLLMIDNSMSMGDKQELLRKSIPDLVLRLVAPNCVDVHGNVLSRSEGGACAAGTLEFAPVNDLHVGILTSSLVTPGSDICSHAQNDKAHLVTRTADGSTLANAALGFLSFGPGPGAISDPQRLQSDIAALVGGVGTSGCGFEAQLESWYRFLVQPDPYDPVVVDNPHIAGPPTLHGHDFELLRQRRNFLRPDSLLSILVLTDEDDSAVDPLAEGAGWAFANREYPGSTQVRNGYGSSEGTTAGLPTSACEASPLSAECSSCAYKHACMDDPTTMSGVPCDVIVNDPACTQFSAYYAGSQDSLNTRFFHMKQRFGIDPQFPIYRYVHGLLSAKVPSRLREHNENGSYVETPECTNPIYAAALPSEPGDDLCNLPAGPRSQKLVVLSVIAGAPPDLLHPNMTSQDWVRVLGKDPIAYAFEGIDPHMIQSIAPRPLLPGPGAADDADPVHGRERDTGNEDLQYACTFPLESPRDCATPDPACDCPDVAPGLRAPICSASEQMKQIAAKAYPGVRPLQLARLLGDNAVAASICPRLRVSATSPNFAYRPAMSDFGNRMALSLVPAIR